MILNYLVFNFLIQISFAIIFIFILLSKLPLTLGYDEQLTKVALNISQSSYCMSNLDSWTCATCSSDNIYETKLMNSNELVIFGYNPTYESIFVGFRGSSNIQNWISNIQINQIQPYDDIELRVDKGFFNLYNSMKNSIMDTLEPISIKYNTYNILVTGHSLGGALATLFAFDIMYNNQFYYIKYIITFGSPRVGNEYFSNYFYSLQSYSKRITHYYDIVPHTPEEFLNYHHVYNEIWYNENNSLYKICDDEVNEDDTCSNSCSPTKCRSIDDHLNYLNMTMGNEGIC